MSFALDAAIAIRKRVRVLIDGEMTPEFASLVCEAERACAALSPAEFGLYAAWAWSSLSVEEQAMKLVCRGDA